MPPTRIYEPLSNEALARISLILGYSLFGLFVCGVVGGFLPVRLLDSSWQLQLTTLMVNNGAYLLLGLFLVLIGPYVNPGDQGLLRRQSVFRSLACWFALSYFLLAPLEISACVRILAEASKQLALDHQQSIQAIAIFRSAIVDSDSLADLKQRFL